MPGDNDVPKTPGGRLRRLRRQSGMTQVTLGGALGVSQPTISAMEKNEAEIGFERGRTAAKLFKVPTRTFTTDPRTRCDTNVFVIFVSRWNVWQRELAFELFWHLDAAGFSYTPLFPSIDFEWGAHRARQEDVLRDKAYYAGGIVINPIWGGEKFDELSQFKKDLGKPVVFVDQNPPFHPSRVPEGVSYVSFCDERGGTVAGKAVLELQRQLPEGAIKRILIISADAKYRRFEAFKREVGKGLNCEFTTCAKGEFTFDNAANMAFPRLSSALRDNKPYDLVYCTADWMALGCLSVIAEIHKLRDCTPHVIGYDGVRETKLLAEHGDIAGVVIQDASDLARAAVKELVGLCEKERTSKIVTLHPKFMGSDIRGLDPAGQRAN